MLLFLLLIYNSDASMILFGSDSGRRHSASFVAGEVLTAAVGALDRFSSSSSRW